MCVLGKRTRMPTFSVQLGLTLGGIWDGCQCWKVWGTGFTFWKLLPGFKKPEENSRAPQECTGLFTEVESPKPFSLRWVAPITGRAKLASCYFLGSSLECVTSQNPFCSSLMLYFELLCELVFFQLLDLLAYGLVLLSTNCWYYYDFTWDILF